MTIVKLVTKPHVSLREEADGLDTSEHGESAYPSFNGMD
jgi:Amt family ammonium transporter